MKLIIHFDRFGDGATVELERDDLAEITAGRVYDAANRIEGLEHDQGTLVDEWQRELRRLIDVHEVPSMSVGDWFELRSDNDTLVLAKKCEPIGWRNITDDVEV